MRGLDRFDGRAAFTTWAHRVATNACLDELRRRARRPSPGLGDDDDGAARLHRPAAPGALEGLPDRMTIDDALAQLPLELRAAVVLRDLCDLDYAAIAEALRIPAGTVRSRIARGRSRLAALLGTGNPAGPPQRPTHGTVTGQRLDTGTSP